jgi:predicted  nucleic acid-binding Zn-ribbon protein
MPWRFIMIKRISAEEYDKKIISSNKIRLTEFTKMHDIGKFKCLICNYEYITTFINVYRNGGCKSCSGKVKLSFDIVNNRLLDRNITLISNYINNKTISKFKCGKCEHEWKAKSENVLHGSGCPKCANNIKYTREQIVEKLKHNNLILKGEYKNNKTPVECECTICGHIFLIGLTHKLISKSKCLKCANKLPLSNKIIDERMQDRTVKRVGDYKSIHIKISWLCLVCNHKWLATPSHVTNGKRGCPKCSGNLPLTNEIIDERIQNRNIIRIGNFINSQMKIEWECTIHNYRWLATPSKILTGRGCSICSKVLPLTNEIIDERLKDRPITRIGDFKNHNTPIEFRCDKGHIWMGRIGNINFGGGCPFCLKKNEYRIKKYLEDNYGNGGRVSHKMLKFNDRKYIIDFCVNDVLIEYNGKQHYEPVSRFGGMPAFEKQQQRDEALREYCKNNNLSLLEIPYYATEEEQYKMIDEALKAK